MSRPSFTKPVGSTVNFKIPPDWFITISALSRKNYRQGVFVNTDIPDTSVFFISPPGEQGPIKDIAEGQPTFPIEPRDEPVTLTVSAYYSEGAAAVSAKNFLKPQYASSKLDVQFSAKSPTASAEIPDYVTFFIFVEDTPDSAQVLIYFPSVITIHVVKINPNPIPPPPPSNVIKPYNPVLDLPRPSKFENYLKLDAAKGTAAYAAIKPLDLIVITDGVPNDPPEFELTQVLVKIGQRIKSGPHHPNSLGAQFVQIGSDPAAAVNLPKLLQADTGHIVDSVPYKGPGSISPDKLERILLGGLHPNIRAQQII
ncbi:hypothetical protein DXG03_009509 [Asterophora parasitica]|uniref:VWFA domain-containing protein n=1 Tax=Asterophora parasitica TaxID=117018 RepID=A0A9P7G6M4_9AGAR|nr:hypothetical protein DXG03_009509 [Asterophora parasitica]